MHLKNRYWTVFSTKPDFNVHKLWRKIEVASINLVNTALPYQRTQPLRITKLYLWSKSYLTLISHIFRFSDVWIEILQRKKNYTYKASDSQSLLHRPLVISKISSSGPQIPIEINILCFKEH